MGRLTLEELGLEGHIQGLGEGGEGKIQMVAGNVSNCVMLHAYEL